MDFNPARTADSTNRVLQVKGTGAFATRLQRSVPSLFAHSNKMRIFVNAVPCTNA